MARVHMHDFNKLRYSGAKNARAIAVLGDLGVARCESVEAILRGYKEKNLPVHHSYAENSAQLFLDLSQRNMYGSESVYVAENAAEWLSESDVPKLHRLLAKVAGQTNLIVTGSKFTNLEVAEQFKRSMSATYNINFSSTDAGQKHVQTLVEREFDLSEKQAILLSDKLQYNVDSILQLSTKAKAFDNLTYPELDDLAEASKDIAFAEALIRLRLADAMSLTENMTRNNAEMTLLTVLRHFRHITTIYPVTRQVKMPGVAQSKQVRLPLKTIQRWWTIAGRYPPREQIRRHLLLVETSDRIYREPNRAKNTFGAFERLVLSW